MEHSKSPLGKSLLDYNAASTVSIGSETISISLPSRSFLFSQLSFSNNQLTWSPLVKLHPKNDATWKLITWLKLICIQMKENLTRSQLHLKKEQLHIMYQDKIPFVRVINLFTTLGGKHKMRATKQLTPWHKHHLDWPQLPSLELYGQQTFCTRNTPVQRQWSRGSLSKSRRNKKMAAASKRLDEAFLLKPLLSFQAKKLIRSCVST